ncbi:MAG TPA: DnaD domain protein [Bacilli bacterium]
MAFESMADKPVARGMAMAMQEGDFAFPYLLLRAYRTCNLTDTDVLLLLHLLAFYRKEHNDFPALDELLSRMSASQEQVADSLRKLMKDGWIAIEEGTDPQTGIHFERYNLEPLFAKLAAVAANAAGNGGESPEFAEQGKRGKANSAAKTGGAETDIFTIFEQEFARPLSPMECETITTWLDKDRYSKELICFALKEAVFSGKLHFRYIDRILLEWSRNRVTSVEEAREHARKFRGSR